MKKDSRYLLVDMSVLPEVFPRVVEAKRLIAGGKVKSVNEAVRQAGISRSAFYKYKDSVQQFFENSVGKVITLFIVVEDFPGILARIIHEVAAANGNILTINQNIPINGLADVTIAIETESMSHSLEEMVEAILLIDGVRRQEILARE
ncbi:MAG TPA: ACT domain-containing protein [Clostridiales bacterium]|nr:ACT domain-containing protein [Clostridiales bacterium]